MKLVFIDNWLAYEKRSSATTENLLFIGILIILFETLPLVIEWNLQITMNSGGFSYPHYVA